MKNESNQESLEFLSAIKTTPNALAALQGYGQADWSPRCNTASSFSNLNLNSTEEEDVFLYGESISITEEHICVENDRVLINVGKPDTAWSDEEDEAVETSGSASTNLNSTFTKHILEYDSQNKVQRSVKPLHIESTNILDGDAPALELSLTKGASQKLEYESSVLSPVIVKNEFPEVSSNVVRNESQCHISDQSSNKQMAEDSNVNINSGEEFTISTGTGKTASESDKSSPLNLGTDKALRKRQNPNIINKKHMDNIRDYITRPPRKRPETSKESPSQKHAKCETQTSFFSTVFKLIVHVIVTGGPGLFLTRYISIQTVESSLESLFV